MLHLFRVKHMLDAKNVMKLVNLSQKLKLNLRIPFFVTITACRI